MAAASGDYCFGTAEFSIASVGIAPFEPLMLCVVLFFFFLAIVWCLAIGAVFVPLMPPDVAIEFDIPLELDI